MGKKKRKDFVDMDGDQLEVTLDDFVIPSKIEAFCNKYKPQDHWAEDCDTFTDSQLRAYFKAVVCPLGDPLSIYLRELACKGFKMRDDECGEPVIYAKLK